MTAALPAFLVEAVFYLAAGFGETRAWFATATGPTGQPSGKPSGKAALLWMSAVLPYLLFSLASGTFLPRAFLLLAGLSAILSFWYALFPRRVVYDAGFLVIAALPMLMRTFPRIYRTPEVHGHGDIPSTLGHLAWIHAGIFALVVLREWDPGEFGFWPRAREWKVGAICYLVGIVPLVALGLSIHAVAFAQRDPWLVAGLAVGTFFGILWVVAFSEELFFRGFIERALLNSEWPAALAIAVSAVLFGSAHLWFHRFPDWRQAAVAAVLGIACGVAYWRAGSVRASMVTHAFVVATWRAFFR